MTFLATARYVFMLVVKSRFAGALAACGGLAVVGALALTWLTPGTERRTFLDLSFLAIEGLAIVAPLLGSTVLQIQEFDQRTIWLVLVRPPGRATYAAARAAGLAAASLAAVLVAGVVLIAITLPFGADAGAMLRPVIVSAALESVVLSALLGLVALGTHSWITALVMQAGLIAAGYLTVLMPALARKSPALAPLVHGVYWLLPHLSDFAVREFSAPPEAWYLQLLAVYAASYATAATLAAALVFRRRDL